MAGPRGTEELWNTDYENIPLFQLVFLASGFQGVTITPTAETGAAVQPGKFKRQSGLSLIG